MIKSFLKHKPLIKKTLQHQTATVRSSLKVQASRKCIFYIFCIFLGASFFSFEFIHDFSKEYYNALEEYAAAERESKIALDLVKKNAEGTIAGRIYNKTYAKSTEKWKILNVVSKDENVFGFKSLHFFLGTIWFVFLGFSFIPCITFRYPFVMNERTWVVK